MNKHHPESTHIPISYLDISRDIMTPANLDSGALLRQYLNGELIFRGNINPIVIPQILTAIHFSNGWARGEKQTIIRNLSTQYGIAWMPPSEKPENKPQ